MQIQQGERMKQSKINKLSQCVKRLFQANDSSRISSRIFSWITVKEEGDLVSAGLASLQPPWEREGLCYNDGTGVSTGEVQERTGYQRALAAGASVIKETPLHRKEGRSLWRLVF